MNENICDVDGLNAAAAAFQSLKQAAASRVPTGDLVYLPNNPYSPQELFFISTAQVLNARKFHLLIVAIVKCPKGCEVCGGPRKLTRSHL